MGPRSFFEKVILIFVKDKSKFDNKGPSNQGNGMLMIEAINPPMAPIISAK